MSWRNGVPSPETLLASRAGASLAGRRVLVTGAAGFIGSHLVEALIELGAEVTAFIRYNSRGDIGGLVRIGQEAFSRLRIVSGDIKDPADDGDGGKRGQ